MRYNTRRAFTLVELLVVIAIVGVLLALIMPSLQNARETAITLNCLTRMRAMTTYVEGYRTDNRYWYTPNMTWAPANSFPSFFVGSFETLVQPYIPGFRLADVDYTKPRSVSAKLNPYICPTAVPPEVYDAAGQRKQGWVEGGSVYGNYRMTCYYGYGAGETGSLYKQRRCKREVTGSPSTMGLMGEWMGNNVRLGDQGKIDLCIYRHSDVTNFMFADGHGKSFKFLAAAIANVELRLAE